MLNRTRYNRLAQLLKALTNYLTLHPEFASWPLTKVLEHLSLHELPAIGQQLEPEKPRKRKINRTNAASEAAKARKQTEVLQKEKEKTKKNNPLSPHPLPKEKENNKEKETVDHPHRIFGKTFEVLEENTEAERDGQGAENVLETQSANRALCNAYHAPQPMHPAEQRNTVQAEDAESSAEQDDTASRQDFRMWNEAQFKQQVLSFSHQYPQAMLHKFFTYWSDSTPDGVMRFQMQKTFVVAKRLTLWAMKEEKLCKPTHENRCTRANDEIRSHLGFFAEEAGSTEGPSRGNDKRNDARWESDAEGRETTYQPERMGVQHPTEDRAQRGTRFVRGEQSLPIL